MSFQKVRFYWGLPFDFYDTHIMWCTSNNLSYVRNWRSAWSFTDFGSRDRVSELVCNMHLWPPHPFGKSPAIKIFPTNILRTLVFVTHTKFSSSGWWVPRPQSMPLLPVPLWYICTEGDTLTKPHQLCTFPATHKLFAFPRVKAVDNIIFPQELVYISRRLGFTVG